MSTNITQSNSASNSIVGFSFHGAEVRTVVLDGEPAFVGKDVCERLGYSDPTNAMKQHCRGVVKRHPIVDALGRTQEARILSEPDVLRLIVRSKLPEAVEFERWLFEEVLPQIRKTGSYGIPSTPTVGLDLVTATQRATALFRSYNFIGKLTGLSKNQASISANQAAKKHTGVDLLGEIGQVHIPAPEQTHLLSPTALGQRLGISNREVNKLLEAIGYQIQVDLGKSKNWQATERGLPFSEMQDTGKKHGDGTPVRQLKWRETIIPVLTAALEASSANFIPAPEVAS